MTGVQTCALPIYPHKYAIIPKHKVLSEENGIYEVAVYWGLDESRVLRNLGVKDVPSHHKTLQLAGQVCTNGSPNRDSGFPHTQPQSVLL